MAINRQSVPFIFFFLVLTLLVRNNSFFWDSIVIGAGYANFYYTTGFNTLFVPSEIAGYPPLFGMYLALGWKLFGKSLAVSHFMMLPFLVGIVLQVQQLAGHFIKGRFTFWVLLLVLLEPTFLAQATQVSPDIILVFLYLYSLTCILHKKRNALPVALLALALLSPRGAIMVAALFFTQVASSVSAKNKHSFLKCLLKALPAFVPAFILTCFWLYLHYNHYGWILYNRDSAWGQGAALVDLKGFFKNILIIGWRFADFGKVVPFMLLLLLLFRLGRQGLHDNALRELLVLILVPLATLTSVLLFYQNPIAHRYFIVVFMLSLLLLGYLLQYVTGIWKKVTYTIVVISLLAGHYLVALYPEKIAKGWDGTLAHLPYFELRRKMLDYLQEQSIAKQEVGSAYPNLRTSAWIDLDEQHAFEFPEKDFQKNAYILYSNIFNDFTDAELLELERNWKVKKEFKDEAVFIRLYERR